MDTKHQGHDNRNIQKAERRQLRNLSWNCASQLIVVQSPANTHVSVHGPGGLRNPPGTMTIATYNWMSAAQFSVKANRGHVVVLHPVKKKEAKNPKKKIIIRFYTGLWVV
jgi:hypothetical protein